MMLWFPILRNPNSPFATVCSFVPPISPFVMVLRISGSEKIPQWEIPVSILVGVLSVIGVLDSLAHLLQTSGFGSPRSGFHFNGFWIFSRLFAVGVAGVFVWSLVNLFVTLLYNLVSDVVGGIQVTLGERR